MEMKFTFTLLFSLKDFFLEKLTPRGCRRMASS